MKSLNKCQFIGRLGQDPEVRYSGSGTAIANLSLACDWKYGDNEGTEWVRIVAFGKLGEIAAEYLHKGDMTYVSGRMQTRKWQDQAGNDRYSTEIVAEDVIFLSPKGGGGSGGADRPAPTGTAPQADPDDDITF